MNKDVEPLKLMEDTAMSSRDIEKDTNVLTGYTKDDGTRSIGKPLLMLKKMLLLN